MGEPLLPIIDLPPQASLGQRKRCLALCFRLGLDQVSETLSLGQVYPSVLERPPGELTGLGQTEPWKFGQGCEHGIDDRTAAMALKFDDILSGGTRRSIEPKHQGVVENAPPGIAQGAQGRAPSSGKRTSQAIARLMCSWPADPYDAHSGGRAAASFCSVPTRPTGDERPGERRVSRRPIHHLKPLVGYELMPRAGGVHAIPYPVLGRCPLAGILEHRL